MLPRQPVLTIIGFLALCFATQAMATQPTTNVTAANSTIPNSNIASSTWITLAGPVLTETGNKGIAAGTLILNAPTGFEFNAAATVTVAVAKVSGNSGSDMTLTSNTATVTATSITINVATSDTGNTQDNLTWSGIQVMPTGCLFPAQNPGNITISGTSITIGGTNLNTTNAGALTETGSTALTFIQQPINTLINTTISPPITINACGNGTSLPNVTVALTTAGGATLGGTLTTATANATGLATFSNLSVNLGGTYTLTATSPGLTSIVSNSFVIYYPAPTTTSISPASVNIGASAFTLTVNGTNFFPSSSVVWFAGTALTTTYVSATQLTATVPSSLLTTAGSYNITVVNPATSGVGGGTSNAQVFTVSSVSGFNAFETSTASNAISGSIYTKLSGTAFGLDVVAIAGSSKATGFSGNVKVDLLANTGTPGSGYGADNCPASSSVIQTIASSAIASGRSTVNFSAVANAYRDVRVRISYPTTSPTISICSTDSFAIRPAAFTITSSNATNTGTSGLPAIKAGASFNLTATAVAGYDGTPSLDASQVVGTSAVGLGLSGSFGAANSATGVATGNSFTYSEVGNFGLNANAVYDTGFTSVDPSSDCTADFSNALAGGKYGCKIGSNTVAQITGSSGFGRFIPDHFDTAVIATATVPMPCPTGLTCPTLYNGFVYSGQLFTTQMYARNLAGATTLNYDSARGYSKAVTLSAYDAVGGATANPGGGALTLNTVPSTLFNLGVATTSTPIYTFPTTPVAPTDIYIRAVDTDSVTSLRVPANTSVEGGVKAVSGRVNIGNAYGSELLQLPMTATVQYYNAAGSWVASLTDSVTSLTLGLSNYQCKTGCAWTTTPTPASGAIIAGVLQFTLSKPTGGGTGSVDVSINTPGYLLTGSNGAAVNPSTTGRATFGVYKGNSNFIYLRENY